ncbi:MAG: hypothetical protein WA893_04765 [Xanthobacteraceae bacterium]
MVERDPRCRAEGLEHATVAGLGRHGGHRLISISHQAAKSSGRLRHARSISAWRRLRLDDLENARSDPVLQIEKVVDAAIELIRPKMGAALGINELRGDTKTAPLSPMSLKIRPE